MKHICYDYSGNGVMSADHLRRFLVEVQREENATMEDAQDIMNETRHFDVFHRRGMNLEAFFKFLFGNSNPPINFKLGVWKITLVDVWHVQSQRRLWIPNWDEVFEFPLTVLELALLRIEVHEHDRSEKDDFGGQTCLPISWSRKCIRAVPLHSRKGDKYNSVKLLMRFEFV